MVVPGKTLELFPSTAADAEAIARDTPRSTAHAAAFTAVSAAGSVGSSGVSCRQGEPLAAAVATHAKQWWLALHLPSLPLEVAGPSPSRGQEPRAVTGMNGAARVVIACNAAARRLGISPGMGVNAAHALSGRLQTADRQPDAERQLLDQLADWAGRFTPRVSVEFPDAVLLEVKGSRRLFGGLAALQQQVAQGVAARQLTVWMACAPTPTAALWFARAGESVSVADLRSLPGSLARLPVAVTRWPDTDLDLLASMGIRTLGGCLRLPRDGFARRFGPERLHDLDRATGRARDLRRDFRPRERFRGARDFDEEVTGTDRLLQYLDPLVDDLEAFLVARQAGVQALKCLLVHRHREPTRHVFRFASPVARRVPILDVAREQLSRMPLPAPVRAARLESGPLFGQTPQSQRMIFAGSRPDEQPLARLLEKLRARLGPGAIYALEAVPDHRPEHAWRRRAGLFRALPSGPRRQPVRTSCPRPGWLLTDPAPLGQAAGRPVHDGPLELLHGPERIESGWWTGCDVARDYYVARTVSGVRLWIYRERRSPQRWFLHGFFG